MNVKLKVLTGAVFLLGAVAAQAYQTDITVNASVDPTASLTLGDGTALPSSVTLGYTPQNGLTAYKNNIKLWSNAQYDLNVSLAAAPQLTDTNGANPIPLTVNLNGTPLSTTNTAFYYSTLFPNGLTNGSISLLLAIAQKTPSQTVVAGKYSGIVSLVVSQATTKDGK